MEPSKINDEIWQIPRFYKHFKQKNGPYDLWNLGYVEILTASSKQPGVSNQNTHVYTENTKNGSIVEIIITKRARMGNI